MLICSVHDEMWRVERKLSFSFENLKSASD